MPFVTRDLQGIRLAKNKEYSENHNRSHTSHGNTISIPTIRTPKPQTLNPKPHHPMKPKHSGGNSLPGQASLSTWYIAGNRITAEGLKPLCEVLRGLSVVEVGFRVQGLGFRV